jgi:glycosyltransferase involved in cell wall biosynthesis
MVLSLAPHAYNKDGKPVSYEPYVREMNLWSDLFDEVDIYTLVHPYDHEQHHKFAGFRKNNVTLKSLWSFDASKGIVSKIGLLFSLPFVTFQLIFALRKYDVVNIRNSGFFSILLGLITRVFSKPTVTKWAGSYSTFEGESFITKIDRRVVNLYHKKHKVLIYDKVYKKHFVNFIPALMSSSEIQEAKRMSEQKPNIAKRFELIAIGRMYWAKNFELIFEALNLLHQDKTVAFTWHFHMIGDGDLREKLEGMVRTFSLQEVVTFHGALPFQKAQPLLAKSHALIMPGVKEGWPKPIAEAWAHNTYPLGANRGNVPDIIEHEDQGIAFEPTAESLNEAIKKAHNYLVSKEENSNFMKYAENYSLESFQKQLITIIKSII